MQRKLTKQFIYNWLNEALYGEFIFYKTALWAATEELEQVWTFIQYNKKIPAVQWKFRGIPQRRLLPVWLALIQSVSFSSSIFSYESSKNLVTKSLVGGFFKPVVSNFSKGGPPRFMKLLSLKLLKQKLWSYSSLYVYYQKKTSTVRVNSHKSIRARKILSTSSWNKGNTNSIKLRIPFYYSNTWGGVLIKIRSFWHKIEGANKAHSKKSVTPTFKVNFTGSFQKKVKLVNKNELRVVLSFRLLRYLNIINSDGWWYKHVAGDLSIFRNHKAYTRNIQFLDLYEFRLANCLLRAGFFENGYIINNLSKRSCFLINRAPTSDATTPVTCWDIITITKQVWWLIYARFLNFFIHVLGDKSQYFSGRALNKILPKSFLRGCFRFNKILKPATHIKKVHPRITIPFGLTNSDCGKPSPYQYYNIKNMVLSSFPSYLEVSYKLLLIILHKTSIQKDVTPIVSLRGLRSYWLSLSGAAGMTTQPQIGVGRL